MKYRAYLDRIPKIHWLNLLIDILSFKKQIGRNENLNKNSQMNIQNCLVNHIVGLGNVNDSMKDMKLNCIVNTKQ